MKQATTRKNDIHFHFPMRRRLKEGAFIFICSLAIYLFIALISYHESDPAWSHTGMSGEIQNAAGKTGAWFSDILFSLFGYMAYLFPTALGLAAIYVYRDPEPNLNPLSPKEGHHPLIWSVRGTGLCLSLIASCGLTTLHYPKGVANLPMSTGGLLGQATQGVMVTYLNPAGASVMLFSLFLIGITLLTGFSWLELIGDALSRLQKKIGTDDPAFSFSATSLALLKRVVKIPLNKRVPRSPELHDLLEPLDPLDLDPLLDPLSEPLPSLRKLRSPQSSAVAVKSVGSPQNMRMEHAAATALTPSNSPLPLKTIPLKTMPGAGLVKSNPLLTQAASLSLLQAGDAPKNKNVNNLEIEDQSRLVEMRLLEFGVDAKVVGVYPGPVITRFELDLAAGIKVNKITGLAKDLARSLSVVSVRVVEVIPGKSVVGLEIPNPTRELVRLKEVLEEGSYQQATSPLSLALGKDIAGRPVVVDLAKMPHLLVAGTTGAGKSVGLNAMLISLLYKATLDELRLILIDPKMLELAVYDHIPHLLTPVVTDMKDAANALRWCVTEMDRRYQLMAAIGVRNLAGYNQKIEEGQANGELLLDPLWEPSSNQEAQVLEKLPYIVVVVDEFADMMMVVGKKVEELIARIAQKARAAGIHLILATQRPSVDVITGLIKANIPTRIAFQVSSRIDSRTILDQSGAEQLLGHGDMLYLPPGVGVPHRIHGAFVGDDEVHKVVQELRKLGKPCYIDNVVQSHVSAAFGGEEETDELYDQAVMIVTQERKASISLVQRRLKIGYNRAARLIEQMEAEGVVSLVQSNGLREVIAPPPVML